MGEKNGMRENQENTTENPSWLCSRRGRRQRQLTQGHDNVGTNLLLRLNGRFRCEKELGPIAIAAKGGTVLRHLHHVAFRDVILPLTAYTFALSDPLELSLRSFGLEFVVDTAVGQAEDLETTAVGDEGTCVVIGPVVDATGFVDDICPRMQQ